MDEHIENPTPTKKRNGDARRGGVVVALVGLLATAGVTSQLAIRHRDDGRDAQAQASMQTVADALLRYHHDTRAWPANVPLDIERSRSYRSFGPLTGLECLYRNVDRHAGWDGPYLTHGAPIGRRVEVARKDAEEPGFIDPWGETFYLGYSGPNGALGADGGVYLICAGRNGRVDTSNPEVGAGVAGGDDLLQIVSRSQRP